jgi:hypothetical protein
MARNTETQGISVVHRQIMSHSSLAKQNRTWMDHDPWCIAMLPIYLLYIKSSSQDIIYDTST